MNRKRIAALCLFLVSMALGCAEETSSPTLPGGVWSATLQLPGGSTAFGLEIGREGSGYRATLINGQERVKIPVVKYSLEDQSLLLEFPAYGNKIEAKYKDGVLLGQLTLVKLEATQIIPFSASPGSTKSGSAAAGTSLDLSGRWEVTFSESDGSQYPAIGEFAQRGSRLVGTFLTPTGDYRYLAGEVRGDEFTLSTFDGAHAFLFKARQLPGNALLGDFWSGLNSHETFLANRNEKAVLPDADSMTFLKPGVERFTFTFPNPGGQPVSLDDPQFDDSVIIVTLAGSWCPNCHDEAAFMKLLYEKYQDQGLKVVALMFEHTEEFDAAARQVQRFRDKFSLTYQILIAGTSDKTSASDALPQLSQVLAYPTTIFIDRNGDVRRIHTGFSGPGTGDHYTRLTDDIDSYTARLLAETPRVVVPLVPIEVEPLNPDNAVDALDGEANDPPGATEGTQADEEIVDPASDDDAAAPTAQSDAA